MYNKFQLLKLFFKITRKQFGSLVFTETHRDYHYWYDALNSMSYIRLILIWCFEQHIMHTPDTDMMPWTACHAYTWYWYDALNSMSCIHLILIWWLEQHVMPPPHRRWSEQWIRAPEPWPPESWAPTGRRGSPQPPASCWSWTAPGPPAGGTTRGSLGTQYLQELWVNK